MSLTTSQQSNCSFSFTITKKKYLELEVEELEKHCWIAVEKRVQTLQKQGKNLAQIANKAGCSEEELLLKFKQEAEKAWVKKYAKRFHAYFAPRVMHKID